MEFPGWKVEEEKEKGWIGEKEAKSQEVFEWKNAVGGAFVSVDWKPPPLTE